MAPSLKEGAARDTLSADPRQCSVKGEWACARVCRSVAVGTVLHVGEILLHTLEAVGFDQLLEAAVAVLVPVVTRRQKGHRALGGDTLAAAGERLLSGSAGGFTAEQQTADRVQQNEQGSAAPGRAGGRSERQGVAAPETQSTAGTSFRRF